MCEQGLETQPITSVIHEGTDPFRVMITLIDLRVRRGPTLLYSAHRLLRTSRVPGVCEWHQCICGLVMHHYFPPLTLASHQHERLSHRSRPIKARKSLNMNNPMCFFVCCFTSKKHLRSFQDGYRLVTVRIHFTFIVLPQWETRPT